MTARDPSLLRGTMDMTTSVQQQRLFFATGRRQGDAVESIEGMGLRPALLARYRDLSRLRYDFPLVLVDKGSSAGSIRALSSIVDELLGTLAPRGLEGERLRRHVLRLEHTVRAMMLAGERGRLADLWLRAAAQLARPDDPSAETVLAHLADKLAIDGELVDCDGAMPARVLRHLWEAGNARKAKAFEALVGRLVVRLSGILRAAFIRSEAGRQPASLRATLGGGHRDLFDFDVMSKLVGCVGSDDALAPTRRARIEQVLDVLQRQRFYPPPGQRDGAGNEASLSFRYDDCAAAVVAFRARLPELAALVKAIAIAELEADGRYVEAQHDAVFEHFDEGALTAEDLALFPDYFIAIAAGRSDAAENSGLLDLLSAGLPFKVLVQTTDPIEAAATGAGHFAFGVRSMRLANTATGLGGVFVVQAAASHLSLLSEKVERAFAHRGAALFSVYAAPGESPAGVAPYLVAAAAADSRAFPAFAYDPYAGDNQATRFSLEGNPEPEADWPVAELEYADEQQQRVAERAAFTIADFALCDARHAAHFARVPRAQWNDALVPVSDWLARDATDRADVLPYVLAVDADDVLQRVLVDDRMMRLVVRGRTYWHRLQEQGGIHNSHAEMLLARERAKWEAQARDQRDAGPSPAEQPDVKVTVAAAPRDDAVRVSAEAVVAERNPDEPWIETARCSSCNECQVINDRMFKYNDNKQAYIADASAGTYRELVLAAEACQVAVIHPGKPRNPEEPGLAELLERAQPFLA